MWLLPQLPESERRAIREAAAKVRAEMEAEVEEELRKKKTQSDTGPRDRSQVLL
jgi:TRAP-type C4-dicarboxylate transport system substrate-binding protein